MFPQLSRFEDIGILLLGLMVGAIFASSGLSHLRDPEGRSKSIGMSKGFTVFLGTAEFAGAIGVMIGVLTQLVAAGLILLMLGAIQKEAFRMENRLLGQTRHGWLAL